MTQTQPETRAADAPRGPQSLRAVWPAMVGLSAVFLVEMLDAQGHSIFGAIDQEVTRCIR